MAKIKIDYNEEQMEQLIRRCNFNIENKELEVLKLRNKGMSYVSIAIEIGYSPETVKRRLQNIRKKIEQANH